MEPPLTPTELAVVHEALEDEYRAWAIYEQVLTDHGPVRPFTNIRDSEARHAEALATLLRDSGAVVPPNTWPGRVPRYASVREACEAGVTAETENAAMYDRLLAQPVRDSVRRVLRNLQRASQERHLAAFRRGAERGRGPGRGAGRGPGPEATATGGPRRRRGRCAH